MLKNHWYLICPEKEVGSKPLKRRLVNEPVLIFRQKDGAIVAVEDRCCHRNVPLSLGYKKGDRLVCAYHGWEYDGSGSCVHIPSHADEQKIPQTARIKTYPTKIFNRWLWVFVGEAEKAEFVQSVNIPEMQHWPFTYREYIFKASLESAAESLIDPYHINYAHRNSIRSFMGAIDEAPAQFNLKFVDDGIEGDYQRANIGNPGEKIYFGKQSHHGTAYRFWYPNLSYLKLQFKGRSLLIVEHVAQVDEDHISMMQISLWDNIFSKFPWFARWFMARKSHKIVQEDIELLSSQYEILKRANGNLHEVSVKGDEVSLAFRKFWQEKMEEEK